jgi:hypothetical protein
MPNEFQYDVLLSHSLNDKVVVRPRAERLQKDELKVWFNEWEIPKTEDTRRSTASQLHSSSFILHPFLDATIRGSLAQFL